MHDHGPAVCEITKAIFNSAEEKGRCVCVGGGGGGRERVREIGNESKIESQA